MGGVTGVAVPTLNGVWAYGADARRDAVSAREPQPALDHRRHGYGAAITGRAVHDGLAQGARWAWLQSSADGYGIYQKLGFRTQESWECWVAK